MRPWSLLLLAAVCAGCPRKEEPATINDAGPPPVVTAPVVIDATPPPTVVDSTADSDDAGEVGDVAETAPFRREEWEVAIGKWNFPEPGSTDGAVSCECKATSSLLYWKAARPKDFDVSVEVMFLTVESSAGIIFRERGEDFYEDATFYQFEWYTRGTHHDKRLSLMKKNPYWVQIVTPKEPEAPLNKWIRFRVRAEGDHLQTWIDDELAFDKRDATFLRTGRIGLHVFQPRKIKLRDFRLTVLDR